MVAYCLLKIMLADILKPILEKEIIHESREGLMRRPMESNFVVSCGELELLQLTISHPISDIIIWQQDQCDISIFSGAWFCTSCGHEICLDCHAEVRIINFLLIHCSSLVCHSLNSGSQLWMSNFVYTHLFPFLDCPKMHLRMLQLT